MDPSSRAESANVLLQLKDEILEVLNQLRQTYQQLEKGVEIPTEQVQDLLSRGDALAQKIASLEGMQEAGREFQIHIQKIGRAIKDLQNFDALKKEHLVTEVKF